MSITLISADGSTQTVLQDYQAAVQLFITYGQSWEPIFAAIQAGKTDVAQLAQGTALAVSPQGIAQQMSTRVQAIALSGQAAAPQPAQSVSAQNPAPAPVENISP